MNPFLQVSLKLFFGLWGLLGIALHLLDKISEHNKLYPDRRVNSFAQMWAFCTSDLPGLLRSVGCYVAIWGIWCAFYQISKQITGAQFAWLSEALFIIGNPWVGILMVFIGVSSDSKFNKAAQKFNEEFDKRLGLNGTADVKKDIGQPPLPPPPPPPQG